MGVNLPYTGIGAEFAQLVDRGMELYLKLNADKVKPYKITLIKHDVKDPGGANAKIVVQELLTQNNVDILVGWIYSPNAMASAPSEAGRNDLAFARRGRSSGGARLGRTPPDSGVGANPLAPRARVLFRFPKVSWFRHRTLDHDPLCALARPRARVCQDCDPRPCHAAWML